VFDLGVDPRRCSLLARLDPWPFEWYVGTYLLSTGLYELYLIVGPNRQAVSFSSGFITGAHPHFPYGISVEPD